MYHRHPRGAGQPLSDLPAATARMMRIDEIERHAFKDGGIFLGASPVARQEDWPLVEQLMQLHAQLEERAQSDPYLYLPLIDECATSIHALATASLSPVGLPPGEDRHTILFSGTRGGKGTSLIVNNLTLYPGSVLCVDPKGENAEITVARRGDGSEHCEGLEQATYVFDPYQQARIDPRFRACWNFLIWIDLSRRDAVERASTLAEALILPAEKAGDNKHFEDNARILLKGLMLFVCRYFSHDRSVLRLHRFATQGARLSDLRDAPPDVEDFDAFQALLFEMMELTQASDHPVDRVICAAATAVLDMGDKERGSVISTMRTHLEFMERECMQDVLQDSDFDPRVLKEAANGASIYLVLPPARMEDTAGWLRMMISVFLETMYADREEPACGHPVLFMLDEFAILRRFKPVERAAGYGAGYHIRLFLVLQDLPQLKTIYQNGAWETFLGNSGCVIAFDVGDNTTAKYLSEQVGQTHIAPVLTSFAENTSHGSSGMSDQQKVQSIAGQRGALGALMSAAATTFDDQSGNFSHATTRTGSPSPQIVPVLQPDEIMRLYARDQLTALVIRKGYPAMDLVRARYFEHPLFRGMFDGVSAPDPREAILQEARHFLQRVSTLVKAPTAGKSR